MYIFTFEVNKKYNCDVQGAAPQLSQQDSIYDVLDDRILTWEQIICSQRISDQYRGSSSLRYLVKKIVWVVWTVCFSEL